jgi:[ribosomal protein S5]-alanine N-acetyltransferase
MNGNPGVILTDRLRLRAPEARDVVSIYESYSSDPEVTRYLAWPRHRSVADAEAFLAFSQSEWSRGPMGPLLIEEQASGRIVGSTGLSFETPYRASVGYLLVQEVRGRGYASEALEAMVAAAEHLGVRRLYAHCHVENSDSRRLLKRAHFELEGIHKNFAVFPNLGRPDPQDTCCYARTWGAR